ncbi:GTPase protein [Trichomonas vaginalis G3]|uniref:GTPase protein n=1 Tax=Trichomonas vaginalis (strain ATCC PRA-98 / G3) TaxID=412133 RepID=UPI0021E535CB|nr:GTPase protein [Trichomonas vaginalis G3]KAI5549930.1 GTPase protein [Trichomonas vaginalis G3]
MQFVNGIFDGLTKPTIGASFVSKSIEIDNSLLNISVWDTAGQELYRGLTPMYYRNAAVAIVVFDVTNKDSFEQVSGWVSELHENTSNAIVCICGNKIDLENRIISTESAKELANNLNLSYYETSAATGEGVDKMFLELSLQILSNNKELAHPMHEESTVQLSEDTHKSKEGCC